MRGLFIVVVVVLFALPAWAETREEELCASSDPDISISGCTAVIQSGNETKENLAGAYYGRAYSYEKRGQIEQAISDHLAVLNLFPDAADSRLAVERLRNDQINGTKPFYQK